MSSIFDNSSQGYGTVKRKLLFEGQSQTISKNSFPGYGGGGSSSGGGGSNSLHFNTISHFNTIGPSTKLMDSPKNGCGRENKFATVRRIDQLIHDDFGFNNSVKKSAFLQKTLPLLTILNY
jgi:hypothetical protein